MRSMTFVHDHRGKRDQIRHAFGDLDRLVEHREPALLLEGNTRQTKFNHQSVFVRLLVQSVPELVQHRERRTNDLEDLILQDQIIRVH